MAGVIPDAPRIALTANAVWLVAAFRPEITLLQWLYSYMLLIAYATLIAGMSTALLRLRLVPVAASAITVIFSLIWLTWPVWLSPYLRGPRADAIVARLVWVHPLFAINGVLASLGTWGHWPIAYRQLTTLGQDIPYTLPASIWPGVLVHLSVGVLLSTAGNDTLS